MYNIRYYALGHSYLLHGPFEGWQTDGFWGMAASEPSKDYFHVFQQKMKDGFGAKVEALAENHAEFERCCTVDATRESHMATKHYAHIAEVLEKFKPNVISVFMGGGNTVAKDEKSTTLFLDVLYGLIKKAKREDAVVVCTTFPGAFEYCKKGAAKYGFIAVDCTELHRIKGPENPYYAFKDYPEYDIEAAAGAVEFRTHPNDKGHELIAQNFFDAMKDTFINNVAPGEFSEDYSFKEYITMEKIPKFSIKTTPEFRARFNGFNVRQNGDHVSFSSAPGTGASVIGTGLHIKGEHKKFFIEMSVESAEKDKELVLTLSSKSGIHEYRTDIVYDKMHRYEFDISDIGEMMTVMKVYPDMEECLVTVGCLGFEM